MTLEYLEIMEDMKKQENEVQGTSSPRRKLQKSFKSNTRIYDDGSIEVEWASRSGMSPQARSR